MNEGELKTRIREAMKNKHRVMNDTALAYWFSIDALIDAARDEWPCGRPECIETCIGYCGRKEQWFSKWFGDGQK
jgi:hypothetical protein